MWSTLAPEYPGLEPIEIGAVRYASEEGNFSYTNCVVAEREGEVIGQLCTYPVEASAEDPDEPVDPILEPYGGWRYRAPSTSARWPCSMSFGEGSRNTDARHREGSSTPEKHRRPEPARLRAKRGGGQLYEREGFREVDRAPVVPHPLIHHTGDVILMTADV